MTFDLGLQTSLAQQYPFACRVPGSTQIRDNSRGILQYCSHCTARTQYRKCCRSDVEHIEARLHKVEDPAPKSRATPQRLCSRCGKESALPGRKTGAKCQKQSKQSARRYMEHSLHPCAKPGCTQHTTGIRCKRHAAELRELKKHEKRHRKSQNFSSAVQRV